MNKLRVLTGRSFSEGEREEAGCRRYLESYDDYVAYKDGLIIAPSFTAKEMGDTLKTRKMNVNRAVEQGISFDEAMRMYLPRNLYVYPELCVDQGLLMQFEQMYRKRKDSMDDGMYVSPLSNPRTPTMSPTPMILDDPRLMGGKRRSSRKNVHRKGRSRRRSVRRSKRTSHSRRR